MKDFLTTEGAEGAEEERREMNILVLDAFKRSYVILSEVKNLRDASLHCVSFSMTDTIAA